MSAFTPRTWRVPAWVRVLALAQAAGWVALVVALGLRGDESVLTWTFLVVLVVLAPYFAFRPSIRLDSDGALTLRGWFTYRRSRVGDITRVAMTTTGLRFEFRNASSFTSVVFQATRHLRYPRVFDFVEAVSGKRPDLAGWNPMDAARPGGIRLIPPTDYE